MDNRIKLICEKCGKEYEISKRSISRRKKNRTPNWCITCLHSENGITRWSNITPEKRKEFSDKQKQSWKNKSEEDKNKILKKRSDYWKTHKEQRKEVNKKIGKSNAIFWGDISTEDRKRISDIHKQLWNNLSEEEKLRRGNNAANVLKGYYENITDDEREVLANKKRETFANLSKEERKRRSKMFSQIMRDRWANMSDERIKEVSDNISRGVQGWWDHMSKEEFMKWSLSVQSGINADIDSNKLEKEFHNELKSIGVEFEFQYISTAVYPDFDKLFPFNPIMKTDRISPYHKWDFKLNFDIGDILVDIDGSIHDPSKTDTIVKNFKGSFNLREATQFTDSQRPYQTDGLDAYVIKCYDDKLTNDVDVFKLNNEKHEFEYYSNYKDFIKRLCTMSMVNKEDLTKVINSK